VGRAAAEQPDGVGGDYPTAMALGFAIYIHVMDLGSGAMYRRCCGSSTSEVSRHSNSGYRQGLIPVLEWLKAL